MSSKTTTSTRTTKSKPSKPRKRCEALTAKRLDDAKEIEAQHLTDAGLFPFVIEQGLGEARQLEARGHVARRDDRAVPVAAERDMVFAGDVDHVLEVTHDGFEAAAE